MNENASWLCREGRGINAAISSGSADMERATALSGRIPANVRDLWLADPITQNLHPVVLIEPFRNIFAISPPSKILFYM